MYVEYTFNDNVVPLVNDKIADPVPETREEELSDWLAQLLDIPYELAPTTMYVWKADIVAVPEDEILSLTTKLIDQIPVAGIVSGELMFIVVNVWPTTVPVV